MPPVLSFVSPEVHGLTHIPFCNSPDHQSAGADVPPKDRLPILRGTEGSLLWLVCPGGQVRIINTLTHTHTHSWICSPMYTLSSQLSQTPTNAISSVKHSGVLVECFIADTFNTPWCLYSIFCCPWSPKELKLFVSLMRWSQTAIYSHQPIFIRVWSRKEHHILQEQGWERKNYTLHSLQVKKVSGTLLKNMA